MSQVCPKSVPREIAEKLLRMAASPSDAQSLMKVAGQTNRTRFRTILLKPLIAAGLLESTIPDKPRSNQIEILPVTRETTAQDFRLLVKLGLAKPEGKGRSTRYVYGAQTESSGEST
jgi:hypothetical protein